MFNQKSKQDPLGNHDSTFFNHKGGLLIDGKAKFKTIPNEENEELVNARDKMNFPLMNPNISNKQ